MASHASLLLMLQAFLLALALSGCMQNVTGLEEMRTGDAALAEPLPKSLFNRRQLAENPQKGKGVFIDPCLVRPPCPPPLSCCSNSLFLCVNLQTDPRHCGSCTTVCPISAAICCSGKCSNTLIDPNNCGICGKKCPFPGKCTFGLCTYSG